MTKQWLHAGLVVIPSLLLALANAASAQTAKAPGAHPVATPAPASGAAGAAAADCARARAKGKPCVLTLDEESLTGDRPSGEGHGVVAWQFHKMASLLRIRADFVPEIIKSAEDL